MSAFVEFDKIPRLNRECVVTEKIDGTNACIVVDEDGSVRAQSRTQIITPDDDNFGFARWVHDNVEALRAALGPGHHFGEWWGLGIQRNYGLTEKRFSLFNVARWEGAPLPARVHVVPVLWRGKFSTEAIHAAADLLRVNGSSAAPGFMKPEGVVVWHEAARTMFKMTLERDSEWKGKR